MARSRQLWCVLAASAIAMGRGPELPATRRTAGHQRAADSAAGAWHWTLVEPACRDDARLLPGLGVLHRGACNATSELVLVLPTGRTASSEPRPTESWADPDAEVIAAVGPWPTHAWGRATQRRLLYGEAPGRVVVEWVGSRWVAVEVVSDLTDDGFLEIAPWGSAGAIAVPFLYGEQDRDDAEGGVVRLCKAGRPLALGTSDRPPPPLLDGTCDFSPEAFATSTNYDAFLAGRKRRANTGIAWGPLEVHRWRSGISVPERDDLADAIGFAPTTIDSWNVRTLLVVSADEAYFAVIAPASERSRDEIVLLRFNEREWTQTLRASPPWGGHRARS